MNQANKFTSALFKINDYLVHQVIKTPRFELFFDGIILSLTFKKSNFSFAAVSGRPEEKNNRLIFDYSKSRQNMKNVGPIPEGMYFIKSNEIQKMSELSILDKVIVDSSILTTPIGVKIGKFPGGYYAWGSFRSRIYKDHSDTQRDNFFIHGGAKPGSAGCIDLWKNNDSFFQKLEECLNEFYIENIPLRVNYNNVRVSCDTNINYRIIKHPLWGNNAIDIYTTDSCTKD